MTRLSTLAAVALLFMVANVLLFGLGCSTIAAEHILTFGSNGGKKPIPEEFETTLFDDVWIVRVQDDPPVDLVVWILEPRPFRIWVDATTSTSPPAEMAKEPFGEVTVKKAGRPMILIQWDRPNPKAAAPPRGTVMMLQGQGGCNRTAYVMWPIAAALADAGYRVILPDLRSQGDSTGKELGFIVKDAQDIRTVLNVLEQDHLLAGKVGVLGHSYGAAVGGYTATLDDRLATCVLSGLPMTWRGIIEYQGSKNLLWRLMTDGARERTFQRCGERMGYDIDSMDARTFVTETDRPLLLLHGRNDSYVPVGHATEIYNARPDGTRLVIYEDADHGDYFWTRFDEVRDLCLSWFAEHLATTPE